MDFLLIEPLITTLQMFSPECVSFILFGVCAISILLLLKFFGANGLYIYNIVAVIAANIQVLKGVQFSLSEEPVALGTVVFATTYLTSDILTEHFGKEAAKQGVWYCFAAQILMTVMMIMTIGYPPLSEQFAYHDGFQHMLKSGDAISILFTPSPRILLASLLAYAISQFADIWIFQRLKIITQTKWLWFRTTFSTIISAIIDTLIFSVLAWGLLSSQPVSLSVLLWTYIFGTLLTRILISILSNPVIYLSYNFFPIKSAYR